MYLFVYIPVSSFKQLIKSKKVYIDMSGEESSISSRNRWIRDFEEYCASDDLTIDGLHRRITLICDRALADSFFLHKVCLNKNVTLEMIEYLLKGYPQAIDICTGRCLGITFDSYVELAYPLHLACFNKDCPNEVIQLFLNHWVQYTKCPDQVTHICIMEFDWSNWWFFDDEYEGLGGTPLHYYLSRTSNIDLDIVKQLVDSPETLLSADEELKCTPIHIILHNESIGDMFDVLRYLVELNPSTLSAKNVFDQTPLDVACKNVGITAKTIEFLLRVCPEAAYQRNQWNALPIHSLCEKQVWWKEIQMDDQVAIDVLKLLLDAHPDSVTQTQIDDTDEDGLPLQKAATNKSQAFCKILVDAYPESVKRADEYGCLPFHKACSHVRPDTVEYLFGKYPESLHIRQGNGYLPIHCVVRCSKKNIAKGDTVKIIEFLIRHDPECVSKPYQACNVHTDPFQDTVKLLFDLYPEAILIRNGQGHLPIDKLRGAISAIRMDRGPRVKKLRKRNDELVGFLSTQMIYAGRAQDRNYTRTPEANGLLPLHNAIRDGFPLGTIKLLVKGHNDAINVPDFSGMFPLDLACQFSALGVVKYLAELSPDRLNACDVDKDYLLHHACRGGNCEVIEYLLETSMSSAAVSEKNVDDKLPIHLFCEFVNGQEGEDTTEHTETIWRLLTSYPETVLNW